MSAYSFELQEVNAIWEGAMRVKDIAYFLEESALADPRRPYKIDNLFAVVNESPDCSVEEDIASCERSVWFFEIRRSSALRGIDNAATLELGLIQIHDLVVVDPSE